MLLSEVRVLLGNAKYQITGAAAKTAIEKMIEQVESKVLAGEEVKLTMYTHKKNGIVYLLCDAVAVEGTKFVCVALYGSNPKVYAASSLKRMFKKEVETLEVEDEFKNTDKADTADTDDTVPAAVDTNDKDAAADQADTESDDPEVPNTEAADKTEQDDTAANQNNKAANNKLSRGDYNFLQHKTNKLAAEIVKYFINMGYSYQFVSDYVKVFRGKRSLAKIYYTKKGSVRVSINPVCEQEFKRCFPLNKYSFVPQWTLSLKVFIAATDDLKTLHKFLSIVDKLHSEKYEKEVSK